MTRTTIPIDIPNAPTSLVVERGAVARLGGAERDAVLGQVEVEIGGLHQAAQRPRGCVGVKAWGDVSD